MGGADNPITLPIKGLGLEELSHRPKINIPWMLWLVYYAIDYLGDYLVSDANPHLHCLVEKSSHTDLK